MSTLPPLRTDWTPLRPYGSQFVAHYAPDAAGIYMLLHPQHGDPAVDPARHFPYFVGGAGSDATLRSRLEQHSRSDSEPDHGLRQKLALGNTSYRCLPLPLPLVASIQRFLILLCRRLEPHSCSFNAQLPHASQPLPVQGITEFLPPEFMHFANQATTVMAVCELQEEQLGLFA